MKHLTKLGMVIAVVAMLLLGSVVVVFGQRNVPPVGGIRPNGVRGQVTEITANSLTILAKDQQKVVLTVTAQTKVNLALSQSQGSLSDVKVGNLVQVGRTKQAALGEAGIITVFPGNAEAQGQVVAVNGQTISLKNPQGEQIVTTDGSTKFRSGMADATFADVVAGKGIAAFGDKQNDGSLKATLITVMAEMRDGGRVFGKVTNIDGTNGKLTLEVPAPMKAKPQGQMRGQPGITPTGRIKPQGQPGITPTGRIKPQGQPGITPTGRIKPNDLPRNGELKIPNKPVPFSGTLTVSTNDKTKIMVAGKDVSTLADIKVGDTIFVQGQMITQPERSMTAQLIQVAPVDFANGVRLNGEVTKIDGTTFILHTLKGADVTILTDGATQYRAGRNSTTAFKDIQVGVKVMVIGKPVEGKADTIQAQVIGLGLNVDNKSK